MYESENRGYLLIPTTLYEDKTINQGAKFLYLRLNALTGKYGYCYANNRHITKKQGVAESTLCEHLKTLENAGYIWREYIKEDGKKEINQRLIFTDGTLYMKFLEFKKKHGSITVSTLRNEWMNCSEDSTPEMRRGVLRKSGGGYSENLEGGTPKIWKDNNISNNTISNNNKDLCELGKKESLSDSNKPLTKDFKNKILHEWNNLPEPITKLRTITDKRAKKIKSLQKKFSDDEIIQAIKKIADYEFMLGKNDRGWIADFDGYFLNPEKVNLLLEGYYDQFEKKGGGRNERDREHDLNSGFL